jgi:Uma2 family endonuclease
MGVMTTESEVVEQPLSRDELGARYRELCDDRRFENVPGKIEIDSWGRLLMSPATNYHGTLQLQLGHRLLMALGGKALVEASVLTPDRVIVADVAWASSDFIGRHGFETPFSNAPEICVEVVSPSNSRPELNEKRAAYLAAGAVEVWIAYPRSKRLEFFGARGMLAVSAFAVDLAGLFD